MDAPPAAPPAAPAARPLEGGPTAAASSSSASSSSSSLRQQPQQQRRTLSDVLVRAGGSFSKWKTAILEAEREDLARRQTQLDKNCSNKLAMAQINAWSVVAKMRAGTQGNLPQHVKCIVSSFLGEQVQRFSAIAAEDSAFMVKNVAKFSLRARREADRLQAIDFYLGHIHAQAAQGIHRVEISKELCARAPKMANGETVRLDTVFHALEVKGYKIINSDGTRFDLDDVDVAQDIIDPATSTALPLFVSFGMRRANEEDGLFVAIEALDRTHGKIMMIGQALTSNVPASEKRIERDRYLQEAARRDTLLSAIKRTQDEAARLLLERFAKNLAAGVPELEVTQELIDRPEYPRLPSGKHCPLSGAQLAKLHQSLPATCSIFWRLNAVIKAVDDTDVPFYFAKVNLTRDNNEEELSWRELSDLDDPLPFTIKLR
ncbi:unnamed protein product [Amoebophrya sp. A25]|nr:unnamed protein product [Amoebophrya sp. A25]|eukprot:GSA25T00014755001.1